MLTAHIEGVRDGKFLSRTLDEYFDGTWKIANKVYTVARTSQ